MRSFAHKDIKISWKNKQKGVKNEFLLFYVEFRLHAESSFSSSVPGCPACRNGTAIGGLHVADRRGRTCGRFGRRCRTRCPSRRGCAIGVRRRRTPPRPDYRSHRRDNTPSARLLHRGRAKAGSHCPSGSSYYIKCDRRESRFAVKDASHRRTAWHRPRRPAAVGVAAVGEPPRKVVLAVYGGVPMSRSAVNLLL